MKAFSIGFVLMVVVAAAAAVVLGQMDFSTATTQMTGFVRL